MHHHFIINPAAGQGHAIDYIPKIQEYFRRSEGPYTIYTTKGIDDLTQYVRDTAAKAQEELRFYACGGDGTLSEVAAAAAAYPRASVGILPAGTGNDFVRSFEGAEQFHSIEAQVQGSPAPIDLIQVNDRYAVNMLNIGFDCEVALAASRLKNKPLIKGTLAYLAGAVQQLCRPMGSMLQLAVDGKETLSGKYLLCTIAGGRFCGGGFQSSPKARLTDSQIDLAVVKNLPRRRFLTLLPAYRSGKYLEPCVQSGLVTYRQCKTLEILAAAPQNVCIDGEIFPFTSLKINVHPRALRFIVPAGAVMRCR